MEFLAAKLMGERLLSLTQLAKLVKKNFHVQVHPRSIERQLLREKNGAKSGTRAAGRIHGR